MCMLIADHMQFLVLFCCCTLLAAAQMHLVFRACVQYAVMLNNVGCTL